MAGQRIVDSGGGVVRLVACVAGRGSDCESVIVKAWQIIRWEAKIYASCTLTVFFFKKKRGGGELDQGTLELLICYRGFMLDGLYSRLADKLFSVKKYERINFYCLNGTHQEARNYFWLFN